MSKHTHTIVRSLQAAAIIALASTTPALAHSTAQPAVSVAKADPVSAVLYKAPASIRQQGMMAMNVVLPCVRSGPRMVC